MGDPEGASDPDLNTRDWTLVHLPHDWSIIDYGVQDSLHQGPFFRNLPGGVDVGYLRGWYCLVSQGICHPGQVGQ
jgi:hypothetical protein